MSSLLRQFDRQWDPYRGEPRVLVACSGGPDSIALLHLLLQTHPQRQGLTVAHFNHRLRGPGSDRDAQFVADVCRQWRVRCEIGDAHHQTLQAATQGEGLESAARQLRYGFLTQTAERSGARYVATGHTANDQVETVLHHVLRGTGLAGLAGMASHRTLSPAVTLIRPLLPFTRGEILDYLREQRQTYRLDEHNQQRQFVRSRIRHELLPLLEHDYYPGVRDSLLKLSRIAAETQTIIRQLAESLLDRCLIAASDQDAQLDCPTLQSAAEHLCREAFVCCWQRQAWPLQDMTFAHWQQLAALSRSETDGATANLPGGIHARRVMRRLVLRRLAHDEANAG